MNGDFVNRPFFGSQSSDEIHGSSNPDEIFGLNGDDILNGGEGADTYNGGAGNDTYVLSDDGDIDTLHFRSDSYQQDILDVSNIIPDGADAGNLKNFIKVTDKGVYLDSAGQGQFSTESQIARFASNNPPFNAIVAVQIADTSVIQFDRSITSGIPLTDESAVADDLNTITGTATADDLMGTAGSDLLMGMVGDDTLTGGLGADVYDGGEGNDRYVLIDTDSVDELSFISNGGQQDVLDVSALLPAGVTSANLKNYLKVTQDGVYLDADGNGEFSSDDLIATFKDGSDFSGDISIQVGSGSILQFDWLETAGIDLTDGNPFASSAELSNRFDFSSQGDGRGILNSAAGERFHLKLDEHSLTKALGGEGDELLDATSVAVRGSGQNANDADHAVEIHAGRGNDTLRGNEDGVFFDAEEGDDRLEAGRGRNLLIGGAGDDEFALQLESSVDGLKSDLLYDFTSNNEQRDVLDLTDVLSDSVNAGNVHSYVKITEAGVYIDTTGKAHFNEDSELARFGDRSSIDNLIRIKLADGSGLEFNRDEAIGEMQGEAGADKLRAGEGSDIIRGNAGDDIIDGDGLARTKSADHLFGGEGNDRITADKLDFTQGTVDGGTGYDRVTIDEDAGENVNVDLHASNIERAEGSASNDTLDASGFTDTSGGYNRETGEYETTEAQRIDLYGHGGRDTLIGGVGRDYLDGGAHADTLSGGQGLDFLVGGGGSDTFVLADDDELDILWDFKSTGDQYDVIDISAFTGDNFDFNELPSYFHIDSDYVYFDKTGSGTFTTSEAIAKVGDAVVIDNDYIKVEIDGTRIGYDPDGGTVVYINSYDPTATTTGSTVAEDSAANTVVGQVSYTDQDGVEPVTYSITGGNNNGYFAIDSDTGEVTLTAVGAAGIDYESATSHIIQVTATDRDFSSTPVNLVVNLSDINDEAPNVSISSTPINEDSVAGTVVGQVTGVDPDTTAETLIYAISSGNDNGYFAIDSATGQITLTVAGAEVLDYETATSHSINVTVTDGTNTSSEVPFVIAVADVNETPEAGDAITKTATEDLSFTLTEAELLENASDVDGDTLSVSNVAVSSSQVSVADNGNGTWTVTPQNNWSGVSQLTFDISDGEFTVSSQADITITGAADAPQLSVSGSTVISSMNFNGGLASGWTSENSVESHSSGGPVGTSRSGTRVAELDADGTGNPDAYYYSVDTRQGYDHEVSLWVKQLDNYDGTDEIEVVWNGEVLQTIDPTTSWGEVKVILPDTGSANTQLAIREVASQNNGTGPLIDEITLTQIGAQDSTDPQYDKTLTSQEDTRIALDLSASLTDTDGSEILSVALGGIPAGFALTDGSNNVTTDGSDADVTGWDLTNLTITPVANHDTDFTMTLSATATETSTGETSTSTQTIRIDMQPVADAAVISGDDSATVYEDASSTLVKSGSLTATDPDAGEAVFVAETVSGSHGSVSINASGYWIYSADNSQTSIQELSSSQTLKLNDNWDDYVRIESDLVPSDDFTISMWVKPDTVDGSSHGFFGSQPDGTSSRSPSMYVAADGKLYWSSNGTDNISYAGETANVFSEGDWSHITWVKDGGEYRFYKDGNLIHTDTAPADVKLTGFTNLGRINNSFDGELDDIQTYDRALTPSEIADTMGGETQSGLFAHYDFAGYSLNQALEDRAGNHPDGTANGSLGNSDLGDRPDTITDIITVRTADGTTHDINITISGSNDAPKVDANSDTLSVSTNEDTSLTLTREDFLANITDADDADSLSIYDVRVEQGRATITDNHDGTWTLTPEADWSGSGKFSFGVSDGDKLIRTRGEFEVDSVADTPVISFAAGDNPTFSLNEDESFALDLSASFNDFDGSETHSLVISGIPAGTTISDGSRSEVVGSGSLDITSWNYASVTVTPAANSHTDFNLTVTATASEQDGKQSVVTQAVGVEITAVDDAPVSSDVDLGAIDEDGSRVITKAELLSNASDVDGDTLSISSITLDSSAHGALVDNGNDTWTFTPAADFHGENISFTLVVSDGTSGDEATVAVTLDVTSVADAPELQNALSDQTVDEEVAFNWTLPSDTFMDRDGDALSYSATLTDGSELPVWLTFDANTRTFSGTPDDPDLGTIQVRVTASDGALSTSEDVSITVNSVNDLPVLSIDPREADAPVQLNTTTAGDQDSLDMAMRADGGFVAVWVDKSEGSEGRIIGRLFDADGSPEGDEFRVDESSTSTGSPKVAVNDDGSFVVAWSDANPGVKSTVETQSFDASGNPQGGNKTALSGSNYAPEIITLDGGDYVVATFDSWHGMRTEIQVYDSDGNAKSGVITTGSLSGWSDRDYELTDLSDGNWAHAFRKTNSGDIEINIYDDTGNSVGSATVNASEDGFDLVSLADGGIAAVYRDEGSTKLQLFNNNGSSNGSEVDLGIAAGAGLIVESLNDGSIFVGWEEDGGLYGQRFLADGTSASGKTELTDDADASGLSVSEMLDGSLQLGWHTSGIDGDGGAVVKSNLVLPVDDLTDGTVVARVSATDDDIGDTLTFSLTDNAGGRYTIDSSTGDITVADSSLIDYAVSPSHTLTVAVTDGTVTETLDYTIYNNNNNKAPDAADSSVTAREDIRYSFTESDFPIVDPNTGDYISEIRIESLPDAGSLTLNGNAVSMGDTVNVADIQAGNLQYITDLNDNGSDYSSFTFNVADRLGLYSSTSKTLTIDVSPENDAPVVVNTISNQATAEDSALSYQVPENTFTDIDGDSLSYSASMADDSDLPDWLQFNSGTRTFSGVPDNEGVGTLNLKVTATDPDGVSVDAVFNLDVTNVNDSPTAETPISSDYDLPVGVQIGFDASEVLGKSELQSAGWQFVENDAIDVGDIREATLAEVDAQSYADNMKYISLDGDSSNAEAFLIQDFNSNSAYNLPNMFYSFSTEQLDAFKQSGFKIAMTVMSSGAVDISLGEPAGAPTNKRYGFTAGIPDDNQFHDVVIEGHYDANNSLVIDAYTVDGVAASYSVSTDGRDASFDDMTLSLGAYSSAYASTDHSLLIKTLNVEANPRDFDINEDQLFSLSIPDGTFADADLDDTLTYSLKAGAPDWLSINGATGQITGTPDNDGVGSHAVTVIVTDAAGATAESSFILNVANTNDAPDSADHSITLNEDGSYQLSEADFAFSDVDSGDSLQSITISRLPEAGSLSLDGVAVTVNQVITTADIPDLVFAPVTNANGAGYADLGFTVRDGSASSAAKTLTFNVTGLADTAVISGDDSGAVTEDAAATLTTSGTLTVTDPDAGEAGFTAETVSGTYGSLTIDGSGSWSYSADSSQSAIQQLGQTENLQETFTVRSLDGTTQVITLTINGSDDAPIAAAVDLGSALEDTDVVISAAQLLANASDIDGDNLSVSSLSLNNSSDGSLTDNGDSTWTFSPSANVNGSDIRFNFTVSDGSSGDEATGSATIDITAVNDAPTAASATVSTDEDVSYTFSAADFNFADVDSGDTLNAVRIETLATQGTLRLNGNPVTMNDSISQADIQAGNLQFIPVANENGAGYDGFTFKVSDSNGLFSSDSYTMTLNVAAQADIAVISGDDTGVVTEDAAATLMASGTLSVVDPDAGEAGFTAETVSGSYGSLTIDASGNWSYSADNTQTAIQQLGAGDSLTEVITVSSMDGTTQDVTINIQGQTNGSPAILGPRDSMTFESSTQGYVSLDNSVDAVTGMDSGTIELWMRATDTGMAFTIGDSTVSNGERSWITLGGFTSHWPDESLSFIAQTGGESLVFAVRRGHDYFADGEWHHVAVVIDADNNNNTIFVDGVDQKPWIDYRYGSDSVHHLTPGSSDMMTVGGLRDGYNSGALRSDGIDGEISEVSIWNTARSQNEVQQDMTGLTGQESGLRAHWTLSATGAIEQTGNAGLADGVLTTEGSAVPVATDRPDTAFNGETAGVAVLDSLTLGDADSSTLQFARVSVSNNYQSGQDSLLFTDQNGISGSWDSATGVLTLNGPASVAHFETALQTVKFTSTSSSVDQPDREISFAVNDGESTSAAIAQTIEFQHTPVNLQGTGQNDTLIGLNGDDILSGGGGDDILSGGSGSDTFGWNAADVGTAASPAVDTITDFHAGQGGDVIDLSDVLVDDSNPLEDYLSLNFENGDTTIEVKPAGTDVTQKIKLEGVDLSAYGGGATDAEILNNLIDDGNLQID